MSDVKRMDIKEFREKGFLQEANRQFFHPLGLALEIVIDDDGNESLGGVWDYRDDPEGMSYDDELIRTDFAKERADKIQELFNEKSKTRTERYGYTIQPVGE